MSYGSKPNEIRHPKAALLAESYVVQRIQALGYTADLNSEEVNQLTDANIVEVVDSAPTVSLTIDTNDFGSINLINILGGYLTKTENSNVNDGTVTDVDLSEVGTDFVVAIQEGTSGVARSLWFNNCFIDSISGTYQVDGFAAESISMSGSSQTWYLNGYAGARSNVCTFSSDVILTAGVTAGKEITLTEDGIELSSAYWNVGADKDISADGGYTFSNDKRYRVISTETVTYPVIDNEDASPVGGVKEGEIELVMWDSALDTEPGIGTAGAASTKALRIQNIDYEISYDREDLKQLYTGTYYKGLNDTNITASLSAIDSDLEMWALATGNYDRWAAPLSDLSSMSLADFQSMSTLQVRIDVFNTKDHLLHASGTLLKQIYLFDGKVTSVGDSRDVPGRGTQTFDISFKTAAYHGTGNVGR